MFLRQLKSKTVGLVCPLLHCHDCTVQSSKRVREDKDRNTDLSGITHNDGFILHHQSSSLVLSIHTQYVQFCKHGILVLYICAGSHSLLLPLVVQNLIWRCTVTDKEPPPPTQLRTQGGSGASVHNNVTTASTINQVIDGKQSGALWKEKKTGLKLKQNHI